MSDLEKQASTWVPPWQRATPSGETAGGDLGAAAERWAAAPPKVSDVDEMSAEPAVEVSEADAGTSEVAADGDVAPLVAEADDDLADDEPDTEATSESDIDAEAEDGPEGFDEAGAGQGDEPQAEAVEPEPVPEPLVAVAPVEIGGILAELELAVVVAEADLKDFGPSERQRAEEQKKLLGVPVQRRPEPEPEPELPGLGEGELLPALEAILMVVDEPVSEITLSQVLEIDAEEVASALIELSTRYTQEGKGFDLRRAAGGWRYYTRAEYAPYVERFVLDGQQLRLTQASLETLAVIAYKQPVARSRISAIRGVNCDGVIRTLITRGMVEECGTDPDSGAHLYKTTSLFLEKMGLDSVDQLPPLAPFLPDNLEELALHE